jgi:hypothetical protein
MKFRLFGETLHKVVGMINFWDYFGGEKKSLEMYDYAQLKKSYRELQFIGPVADLAVSFIFGNFFKVISDDEDAVDDLQNFWKRNRERTLQAGLEGGLYGNTYLAFEWQEDALKLKLLGPKSARIVPNKEKPWLLDGYESKVTIDNTEIRQVITADTYEIFVNNISKEKGPNPYGLIPIVHVAGIRFSDELFGTGAIDSSLYKMAERYDELLDQGLLIEKYHSNPIPVFGGIKDFADLKVKLESEDSAALGFGISLPSEKAWVKFLESQRSNSNTTDLLKLLFWGVVIQSRLPEYVFGVHMTSAQASTQEQRILLEGTINKRRLVWTEGIQQANKIILKMLEYHQGKNYSVYDTDLIWGPIFEEDKTQTADIIDKKVKAVATAKELGIISMQTARKSLPELIDNPETEAEKIDAEQKTQSDYQSTNQPANQTNV